VRSAHAISAEGHVSMDRAAPATWKREFRRT
jgi:hypothetical protein